MISQRWDKIVFDSDSGAYGENSDEIDEEKLDLSELPLIPPCQALQWLSNRVYHRVRRTAVSMTITQLKPEAVIKTWSCPHLHFNGCPRGGRGDRWDKQTCPLIHGRRDWRQTEEDNEDSDPYSFCFLYFAAVTFLCSSWFHGVSSSEEKTSVLRWQWILNWKGCGRKCRGLNCFIY
jgi:hypothetical protein